MFVGAFALALLVVAYTVLPHIMQSYQHIGMAPPAITSSVYHATHGMFLYVLCAVLVSTLVLISRACRR